MKPGGRWTLRDKAQRPYLKRLDIAMSARPDSPEALRMQLGLLLPSFIDDCYDPEPLPPEEDEPETFHRVMREFTYSFGKAASSLSSAQLRQIGNLVNEAVYRSDNLENAVATCFLEHLHQIHARKVLWPFLSNKARSECYVSQETPLK